MPKAAFQALNLSIKCSRPFPSGLKTDQEVLKARKTVKSDFFKMYFLTVVVWYVYVQDYDLHKSL